MGVFSSFVWFYAKIKIFISLTNVFQSGNIIISEAVKCEYNIREKYDKVR